MINNSVNFNMKKVLLLSFISVIGLAFSLTAMQVGGSPVVASNFGVELAGKLGISMATAGKTIDLLAGGSTVWSVIAIIFGASGGGIAVSAAIFTAKNLIKKEGKDMAAAW
ncbi:uberolysin/carnocyclin family circular bacteriocin [Sediminibacillus massiliensis]|uniref:uberolysin/carnocyclin family circular bacteriocin n=1 Tax=Sediminibacillus massiliensis TaxID=1926277 RepID=UPI0009889358|nr:uberolysin/carnocyclin family circular bacteriocin [Sediminibacillus massiliensis]